MSLNWWVPVVAWEHGRHLRLPHSGYCRQRYILAIPTTSLFRDKPRLPVFFFVVLLFWLIARLGSMFVASSDRSRSSCSSAHSGCASERFRTLTGRGRGLPGAFHGWAHGVSCRFPAGFPIGVFWIFLFFPGEKSGHAPARHLRRAT